VSGREPFEGGRGAQEVPQGAPEALGAPEGREPEAPGASRGFMGVILEDVLNANGLDCRQVEGYPGVLTGTVEGSFGRWTVFAQSDDESLGIVVYSVYPSNVAAERRQAAAELVSRANYVLRYGSLEMDFADGELRARTSARGGPEPLEFNVISELVRTNLELAELLFPAVREVVEGGADPGKVVEEVVSRNLN
jgi:hypothetical protein